MPQKPDLEAYVNDEGQLVLPPEVAERYGLAPGSRPLLRHEPNGLSVRSPLTRLERVYLEPTSYCNIECRTCIRNSWNEPLGRMDDATFSRAVEGIRSLGSPDVFFGGFGEPLAHPRIIEMVRTIKAFGSRAELITNATLLTEETSQDLINSGLDMLWVSLDGSQPESYADVRLGASFSLVFDNLRTFVELRDGISYPVLHRIPFVRPQLGTVFVAMKRNIHDLPAVARLSGFMGATRFMVTNVLPYTAEMRKETLYSDAVAALAYQPYQYVTEIPKFDLNEVTTKPFIGALYAGSRTEFAGADLSVAADRCPFIEKRATVIGWDGRISPCLPLLHDHKSYLFDRERYSRGYSLGNVKDRPLKDLWDDEAYLAFRETVNKFDFAPCSTCGSCELAEANEEDCFGNLFPTCGGCLWAQGVIRCP